MTRTTLLTGVSLGLMISLGVSTSAQANGVRLGFGGPMASFVAVPTHGGSSGGYTGGAAHCAKKKSPSYSVASRFRAAEPPERKVAHVRVDKPVRDAEPHARKPKVQIAAAEISAPKPAPVATAAANAEPEAKTAPVVSEAAQPAAEAAPATPAETKSPTGSQALEQTRSAAAETAKADQPEAPSGTDTAEAKTELACKKFIPSVGVTVDVECPPSK